MHTKQSCTYDTAPDLDPMKRLTAMEALNSSLFNDHDDALQKSVSVPAEKFVKTLKNSSTGKPSKKPNQQQ